MTNEEFERLLTTICQRLTVEAIDNPFQSSKEFEFRVREVVQETLNDPSIPIDFDPHPQAFPDIAVDVFGIEVKFTTSNNWFSVANSVLERNRINSVTKIYVVFGKMGDVPEVRWGEYEKCVNHVRTSHVPRFEVDLQAKESLFTLMGISYDDFRRLPMEDKMRYIREYARGRLGAGERLWWLDDNPEPEHALPMQARLYTKLREEEKIQLRAEAVLLCPQILKSGRSKTKYDDFVLYLLTYRGVLCHQARDLFSAGSVANPTNDDNGGIYIQRSLKLLEPHIFEAANRLEDAVFVEYWGEEVPKDDRISRWLEKADELAHEWIPSQSMFLDYQKKRR